MKREILTHPIPKPAIWEELNFLLQRLQELGHDDCLVRFGYGWADDYYSGAEWKEINLSGAQLLAEVRRMEAAEFGKLGTDDLFVRAPRLGVEFHFCNDSDIHIKFDQPNDVAEFFYKRWKEKGFTPAEWMKTEMPGPGSKLREN